VATRTPGAEDRLRNLGETLRREIKAARARVTELTARRRDLERHLQAARHAERTAIHSLAALESVSREASGLADEPADEDREDRLVRLAGSELREMIARVALRHGAAGEAVHWRQWLDWLRRSEFDAAGKRPEATFQTQLARSPLVRRTEHDGVYRLDLEQFARARDRLRKLHAQLSQLPPPDQLALLGDVRAQRQHLQNEIARTERAVEEMWRVLVQERPPGWVNDAELAPERLVEAWMAS
jgi:hypothetical protein